MNAKQEIAVFWMRRDLRLHDNTALFHALQSGYKVLPIFIFDKKILDKLPKDDKRVQFIHNVLKNIGKTFEAQQKSFEIHYGNPLEIWATLLEKYDIKAVFANRDYEPYALERDKSVFDLLGQKNIVFKGYKDHVIFDKSEVMKADGTPYVVFTPYSKIWKKQVTETTFAARKSEELLSEIVENDSAFAIPSLEQMGFESVSAVAYPEREIDAKIIENYHETRDIPGVHGTTRLGLHLRFGTISIRNLARKARNLNEKYLNELIWRDFYHTILYHFPHVAEGSFRAKYDAIEWRNDAADFERWCAGKTGYPIVDAGMRELNETGYMHNRVRMIVASFLCKHLLISWQWGEAYFAEKLLDFDLAANNGGWQWAAGSGCDAAPYFRVFNPYTQADKFDKQRIYIKKWVPEFGTPKYVEAMVEHKFARQRALDVYKASLAKVEG